MAPGAGTDIPAPGAASESFYSIDYDTQVSGAYAVSGVWTLAGSPYRVNANLFVKKGTSLRVEPGVKVEFQGPYWLKAMGGFSAKGTAAARIVFTTTDADIALGDNWIGWKGIRISASEYDQSVIDHGPGAYSFEYCEVAYVDKTCEDRHPWENRFGSVYVRGASDTDLSFNHNYIHHGRSTLFSFFGISNCNLMGDLTFEDNVFEDSISAAAVSASHVYSYQEQHGQGGPKYKNVFFKGGAIRNYRDLSYNDGGTVASAWDSSIYLQGVEISNCGDESEWFDQNPADAIKVVP
jgi:hypothetical protein